MLRPFLFIGCGGSGLKTIRAVRRNLITAMEFQGLSASDFPDAWQFLAIDVPKVEDTGALQAFAANDYVGLADDIAYKYTNGIDDQLSKRSNTQADFVTWRTDPETVNVDVTVGAGQYRAVGRAVAGLTLDRDLPPAIAAAVNRMQSPSAQRALRAVEKAFLGDVSLEGNSPDPMVFLVSSLGGGAGAGIFMDVSEALRRSSTDRTKWLQSVNGILFDPSIFSDQSGFLSGGIPANTLASVSEIVCGQWNEWPNAAYLPSLTGAPGAGRGPKNTFIFGRTNGTVTLETQDDAYGSAASLLSALVLRPEVIREMQSFTLGNWGAQSAKSGALRIHDNAKIGNMKPVSAIGYGHISLGRDRFRLYAGERITHGALTAATQTPTLPGADTGLKTNEVIKQLVDGADRNLTSGLVLSFLEKCGLNEGTAERDQVLIGLLDPSTINDPATSAQTSTDLITKFIAAPVDAAKGRILGGVKDSNAIWDQFVSRERIDGNTAREEISTALQVNLLEWAASIQVKVLDVVCGMVARDGLLLTRAVVAAAAENEIAKDFPAELRGEAATGKTKLRGTLNGIAEKIKATKMGKGAIPEPVRRLLGNATEQSLGFYTYIALRELAARALEGMAKDLFAPMLAALDDAIELARLDTDSKEFNNLSDKDPRPTLKPAPNELLLVDVKSYRETFDALVSTVTGGERSVVVDCFRGAIGDGIGVTKPTTELSKQPSTAGLRPWQVVAGAEWIPEQQNSQGGVTEQGSPAQIQFRFGIKEIQARAEAWLLRDTRTTGFGPMLRETLGEWLTKGASPAELSTRAGLVSQRLEELFQVAQPMTSLNRDWMVAELNHSAELTYGLSGIPLDSDNNKASWEKVNQVVATYIDNPGSQKRAYDVKARGDIELVTFLSPTVPSAFNSLTEPIVASFKASQLAGEGQRGSFWTARRARPLAEFIPLPRSSQLTLARGWIIGHLLGVITIDGAGSAAIAKLNLADKKYDFLASLLDQGSKDYSFLSPAVGPMKSPDKGWRRAEWFGMILESSLLTEMLAVHGDREPLRALTALLAIGLADEEGGPSTDYMIPGISIANATIESLVGVSTMLGASATGDLVADRNTALDLMTANFASIVQEPQIAYRVTPRATQVAETLITAVAQIQGALGATSSRPPSAQNASGEEEDLGY